jgi:ABC-type phosphate transport system permease subunit
MLSMTSYESALMFSAFLLFIIVVLFNGLSRFALNQIERRYQF